MQDSFRKHQWRETLLLSLATLTQGFKLSTTKEILDEMETQMESAEQTEKSWITMAKELLAHISDRNLIPITIKPHSIFFLCSEQNFVGACFDWILPSTSESNAFKVSFDFKS